MNARLDFFGNATAAKFTKYINSAGKVIGDSTLPATTQETGEDPCQPDQRLRLLHRHAHQGRRPRRRVGALRLNLVAAWREATVFTDAERAALELTEQGTRIADAAGGVPEDVWTNATKYFDEDQLAALVGLIALINSYNRMNVIAATPAGGYTPGQWG